MTASTNFTNAEGAQTLLRNTSNVREKEANHQLATTVLLGTWKLFRNSDCFGGLVKFKCDCKHPQATLLLTPFVSNITVVLIPVRGSAFQVIQEEWLCFSDSLDHLSNTHHTHERAHESAHEHAHTRAPSSILSKC